MTRRPANCLLGVDDFRVNAVLVVLGITLAEAIDAFTPCYTGRLRRGPRVELVRRRVTAGLRELLTGACSCHSRTSRGSWALRVTRR